MKCPNDSAQRAFVDLQMSLHTMDSFHFEWNDSKFAEEEIEQCNSKSRVVIENSTIDDDSGSEEEDGDFSTSGDDFNAMNEYEPDESYDPECMEMHGDHKKYTHGIKMDIFQRRPCLKSFSINHFNDPLEASAIAEGLDRDLISNSTFNSNQYTRGKQSINGNFGGTWWKNILVKVM